MKKILIPVALLLAATTAVTSCKKDDNATKSRHDMFVGNWKPHQIGVDANGNGIWDANEKVIDSNAEVSFVMFKGDGTGTITSDSDGIPVVFPMTWTLQNNESDLRLLSSIFGNSDTIIQKIVSIDESTFILKDTTESPVSFISFNKQ